jgi:hypothetical protein
MTEGRLPLSELLEKAGDGDFLRSVAEAVLQMLMEADVDGLIPVARTADSKVNWCDAIRRDSPFPREKGNGDDCGDYALGPDRG